MAFAQDLLTRIVNVQWGGKIVIGTQQGCLYCGSAAGDFKRVDNGLFKPPFGSVVGISARSDALVAIGLRQGDFFGPDSGCQIVASRDGLEWQVALFDQNVPIPGKPLSFHATTPTGIVWDGTAFHASSHFRDNEFDSFDILGQPSYRLKDAGEQLYVSMDGFSWSKGEMNGGWGALDSWYGIPSALKPYFVKPQNQDDIPDGLQGYLSSGTLGKPSSLSKFYAYEGVTYEPFPPSPKATFRSPSMPDSEQDLSFPCYAVAYLGTWVAVGKTIAVGTPGESFKDVFELPNSDTATCVIGFK